MTKDRVASFGCCTTPECCVKSGCRSPKELHWLSPDIDPLPCGACCEETREAGVCIKRTGKSDDSHYTKEEEITCPGPDDDFCPPCALCTTKDEKDLNDLKDWRAAEVCPQWKCENEKKKKYDKDPCISKPNSCMCWCTMVNPLLEDCLHLEDKFWEEENTGSYRYFEMLRG